MPQSMGIGESGLNERAGAGRPAVDGFQHPEVRPGLDSCRIGPVVFRRRAGLRKLGPCFGQAAGLVSKLAEHLVQQRQKTYFPADLEFGRGFVQSLTSSFKVSQANEHAAQANPRMRALRARFLGSHALQQVACLAVRAHVESRARQLDRCGRSEERRVGKEWRSWALVSESQKRY